MLIFNGETVHLSIFQKLPYKQLRTVRSGQLLKTKIDLVTKITRNPRFACIMRHGKAFSVATVGSRDGKL